MPKTEPTIEAIDTVEDVGVEASEMAPEQIFLILLSFSNICYRDYNCTNEYYYMYQCYLSSDFQKVKGQKREEFEAHCDLYHFQPR